MKTREFLEVKSPKRAEDPPPPIIKNKHGLNKERVPTLS